MAKVTQLRRGSPECLSTVRLTSSGLTSGATLEEGIASFLEPGSFSSGTMLSRTALFPFGLKLILTSLLFVLSLLGREEEAKGRD